MHYYTIGARIATKKMRIAKMSNVNDECGSSTRFCDANRDSDVNRSARNLLRFAIGWIIITRRSSLCYVMCFCEKGNMSSHRLGCKVMQLPCRRRSHFVNQSKRASRSRTECLQTICARLGDSAPSLASLRYVISCVVLSISFGGPRTHN